MKNHSTQTPLRESQQGASTTGVTREADLVQGSPPVTTTILRLEGRVGLIQEEEERGPTAFGTGNKRHIQGPEIGKGRGKRKSKAQKLRPQREAGPGSHAGAWGSLLGALSWSRGSQRRLENEFCHEQWP